MLPVTQGFAQHESIERLLGLILDGDLCHDHDPILNWMADNTVLRTGIKGEKRLAKEAAVDKIDGIAAILNCLDGGVVRRPRMPEPQFKAMVFGGRR